MTNQHGALDTGAFLRSTSLFEEKRKVLAPHAVRDLAEEIVRRVSNLKHGVRADRDDGVAQASIAAFCDLLVQPSPAAALQFILDRQAEGLDRHALLDGYLAGAARMLGARWESDEASFLSVIHGTGTLYALLRALRPDPGAEHPSVLNRRKALFALVPGESHKFGIQLAAETFREAGWDIDLQVDLDHDALVRMVQDSGPAIIGLSLSTEERLADLVRLVIALRLVRPTAIIGVAPALNMADTNLHDIVDIDMVFRDARTAVRDLDWMRQLRA